MKCAVAVIRASSGRPVRRSTVTSNQAGIERSRKATACVLGVDATRRAFEISDHGGLGNGSAVACDFVHGDPGTRSQRVPPITTASGPFTMRYESLFGACSTQCVV